jgi:hypothetical protein
MENEGIHVRRPIPVWRPGLILLLAEKRPNFMGLTRTFRPIS